MLLATPHQALSDMRETSSPLPPKRLHLFAYATTVTVLVGRPTVYTHCLLVQIQEGYSPIVCLSPTHTYT